MRRGRTDARCGIRPARYGDFVLYRPPFKPVTYLLWIGPALFLGVGGIAWFLTIRRRQRVAQRAVRLEADSTEPFTTETLRHGELK